MLVIISRVLSLNVLRLCWPALIRDRSDIEPSFNCSEQASSSSVRMTQTSIELRDGATPMYDDAELHGEPNDAQPQAPATAEFSLPPVDTGRGAWLCLAASWGVEAVTFGGSSRSLIMHTPLGRTCTAIIDNESRLRVLVWCLPRLLQQP